MSAGPVRVYLPLTPAALRRAWEGGGFGPAPLHGHAVTPELRSALAEALGAAAEEEELEHAASTAAAEDALRALRPDDVPARVVAALDVRAVEPLPARGPSAVRVAADVPWRRLASVLADDAGAGADVAAARAALAAADPTAEVLVERCLDRELGWYAVQEVPDLLARW